MSHPIHRILRKRKSPAGQDGEPRRCGERPERDLRHSSGPGGQKVKTSSCVQLVHIPTGLTVKCQRERSQAMNRFLARRLLLDRIEKLQKGVVEAQQDRGRKDPHRRSASDRSGQKRRCSMPSTGNLRRRAFGRRSRGMGIERQKRGKEASFYFASFPLFR